MSLAPKYATDEDIHIRIGPDWSLLVSRHQRVADGTDGVFVPGNRWKLKSESNDFIAQGVAAGMLVHLTKAGVFTPPYETFAVESADDPGESGTDAGITIRRIGAGLGLGVPPGPAAGASGIRFEILTMDPQIEIATFDINKRFNIDPLRPGRSPGNFYDIREVKEITILTTVHEQYLSEARSARPEMQEALFQKAKLYEQMLSDVLGRFTLHWNASYGPDGIATETVTTRFGMRLARG